MRLFCALRQVNQCRSEPAPHSCHINILRQAHSDLQKKEISTLYWLTILGDGRSRCWVLAHALDRADGHGCVHHGDRSWLHLVGTTDR